MLYYLSIKQESWSQSSQPDCPHDLHEDQTVGKAVLHALKLPVWSYVFSWMQLRDTDVRRKVREMYTKTRG